MKSHFDPKPLIIGECYRFHKQMQQEIVAQYVAELCKLAELCVFKDFLEEALRDGLVYNLKSEATLQRLLAEDKLTLKKAMELPQGMGVDIKQTDELQVSVPKLNLEATHQVSAVQEVEGKAIKMEL